MSINDPRTDADLGDLEIRIEGGPAFYATVETRQVIRHNVLREAHLRAAEAARLWEDLDVLDLDAIKAAEFAVGQWRDCLANLRMLVPVEPLDDE